MKTARFACAGGGAFAGRSIALAGVLAASILMAAAAARGQCDGQWSVADGVPGTNDNIWALAIGPDGSVLAGGSFTMAGGQPANHIAKFDRVSKSWSPLGLGVNGEVRSILVLSSGDVVVGGGFNRAGGAPAFNIARYHWSTGAWSALGSGTSSWVLAMGELPDGDVVAGGFFGHASDVPGTSYVARYDWNTEAWSPAGTGVNGYVTAVLVLPSGDVIAGGGFTSAGDVPASHIARYSPGTNTWSSLGLGLNNDAPSLLVIPDGDLLAGGYFTAAGGGPAHYLARYDFVENAWSPVGTGTNNVVNAVAMRGTNLVAGGYFSYAGAIGASRVAKYHLLSSSWSTLGVPPTEGTDEVVRAIVVLPGGDVIVGGDFTIAGGVPANHFARWSAGPTITSQPAAATACPVGTATLSVAAAGSGAMTYQWQLEATPDAWVALGSVPVALPGGGTAFAAPDNSPVVSVGVRNRMGAFNVRCTVWDDCGRELSEAATLSICIADFNCVGGAGLQDLFDYLLAWFARDPIADVNGYGGVSLQDLFDFLGAWFAAC